MTITEVLVLILRDKNYNIKIEMQREPLNMVRTCERLFLIGLNRKTIRIKILRRVSKEEKAAERSATADGGRVW